MSAPHATPSIAARLDAITSLKAVAVGVSKLERRILGIELDTPAAREAFLCGLDAFVTAAVQGIVLPRGFSLTVPKFDVARFDKGVWFLIPLNETALYLMALKDLVELYGEADGY